MFTWGELGLIQVCGKNAASLDAVIAACKAIAGHPGVVRLQDFVINTDVIVLSTPEIAGLPYVISGLVAAGGLAAALSTADGLLLAIANALSHDIYYKMIDPNAPTHPSADGRPRPACSSWRWPRRHGLDKAGGHPGHGRLGVLAGHGRQLPGTGAWASGGNARPRPARSAGIIAGFGLCLFYLVTTRYFPRLRREVLRHDLAAQPGDRRAAGRHRQGHGRSERDGRAGRRWPTRWPTRSAGSTSTTSTAGCWACRSASW